jgi:GxxExxY protein
MEINELSFKVIGLAMKIHREVGPGLLESAYENALVYELKQAELQVKQQLALPFIYNEVKMDIGYRIDILVEDRLILEIKAIESLAPVHFAQTLTYVKLSNVRLGLLINFNCVILKENIHRIINGF